jgi:hypothetical protein
VLAAGKPTIGWYSMLNSFLGEQGFFAQESMNLIFAPPAPLNAKAVIKNASGDVVKTWGFSNLYGPTNGVFARMRAESLSEHTFPVGKYVIEYMVNDELATRLPFEVKEHSASKDAFNPGSKFTFVGPWQELALFEFMPYKNGGYDLIRVHFWAGASDMPAGEIRGALRAELTRNGELIAHNRDSIPTLGHEWMTRQRFDLFEPHEKNDPNALFLAKSAIEQDGEYVLTIKRQADNEVIRSYKFSASGGKLVPMERTAMGYEPHGDYIAPRKHNSSSGYDFIEVFWIGK